MVFFQYLEWRSMIIPLSQSSRMSALGTVPGLYGTWLVVLLLRPMLIPQIILSILPHKCMVYGYTDDIIVVITQISEYFVVS